MSNKRNDQGIRQEWQITLKNHEEEPALIQVLHRSEHGGCRESNSCLKKPKAEELMFEVEMKPGAAED